MVSLDEVFAEHEYLKLIAWNRTDDARFMLTQLPAQEFRDVQNIINLAASIVDAESADRTEKRMRQIIQERNEESLASDEEE